MQHPYISSYAYPLGTWKLNNPASKPQFFSPILLSLQISVMYGSGLCSYRGHITAGEPTVSPPSITASFLARLQPIIAHRRSFGVVSTPAHLFLSSTSSFSLSVSLSAVNSLPHNWVILSPPCSKCQQAVRQEGLGQAASHSFSSSARGLLRLQMQQCTVEWAVCLHVCGCI